MGYSDRLQSIKECDLIDVIISNAEGKPVNLKVVIDDVSWLIEQAEKVERYEKALRDIVDNKTPNVYLGYREMKGTAEKALES